jgi:LuxR family maltose regulon positive regulatory protein
MIEAPRRLAEALIALDRLDQDEVERQLAELHATVVTDELWFMALAVRAKAATLWGGTHVALHEIQLSRVDRAHLLGDGTLAQAQLVASEATLLTSLGHGTEVEILASEQLTALSVKVVRARLLVLSRRFREALAVLASVTQTSHGFSRLRAEALLLTAQAYCELGEVDIAQSYLVKAAPHRDFLEAFASIPRALLVDHAEAVPALVPILTELEKHKIKPPFPEVVEVITLTEREQQLIELLPTPRSRDSIARSLFVSTNTVKTQLQALYRKLGVTSREEAVARAYELGLLS